MEAIAIAIAIGSSLSLSIVATVIGMIGLLRKQENTSVQQPVIVYVKTDDDQDIDCGGVMCH